MERTYRYDRSGLVRDGYTVSTRHIGASNREWRVNSAALNRNRVMKRRTRPVFCRLIFVVMFIVCVLVAAIIIVLVNRNNHPSDDPLVCSPGMSGEKCDSTSFIGSFVWSGGSLYRLGDGNFYSKGIAFRLYAPNATAVNVIASVPGGMESEYAMTLE